MEKLTLDTVADGALPEVFEREVNRVMTNIMDPSTSETAKREIVIKMKIKPLKGRVGFEVEVAVASKLASAKESVGIAFFERDEKTRRLEVFASEAPRSISELLEEGRKQS